MEQSPEQPRFSAFVSYSRTQSAALASALSQAVERFGKPWYRKRVVRVFRDDKNMPANAALWANLRAALLDSGWFVLVASPEAAASDYVDREVLEWLDHRSADRLLIVLHRGEIVWNRQSSDFDRSASTAISKALWGVFADEPRWVDARWFGAGGRDADDPRFAEVVADIACAVRGRERDDLIGENVRMHKRARSLAVAAVSMLVLLLALAVGATAVAIAQRSAAIAQTRTAQARYLAIKSGELLATDASAAAELAVRGYLLQPSSVTRSSLFEAAKGSRGDLVRIAAGREVRVVAASADGMRVYAGREDGHVLFLDRKSGRNTDLGLLPGPVASIATDSAGTVVAASTPSRQDHAGGAVVWDSDGAKVDVPAVESPEGVVVSPSGRWAVIATGLFSSDASMLVDLFNGEARMVTGLEPTTEFLDETHVVTLGPGSGWSELSFPDLKVIHSEVYGFGNRQYLTLAPGGAYLALVGGVQHTPLWSVASSSSRDSPKSCSFTADVCRLWNSGGSFPDYFAAGPLEGVRAYPSPGGRWLAWAEANSIMVSEVGSPDSFDPNARRIPGVGKVSGMRFISDSLLVAAAGDDVLLANLDASDPLRDIQETSLSTRCNACPVPRIVLNPTESVVAFASGSVFGLTIHDLESGRESSDPDGRYEVIIWLDDERLLVSDVDARELQVLSVADFEVLLRRPLDALSADLKATLDGLIAGATRVRDSPYLRLVSYEGRILEISPETLEVVAERSAAPPQAGFDWPELQFDPTGRWALAGNWLIDLETGQSRKVLEDADQDAQLLIAANGLYVVRPDALERLDPQTLAVASSAVLRAELFEPAINRDGTLLVGLSGHQLTLHEPADGAVLGTFDLPAASNVRTRYAFSRDGRRLVFVWTSYEGSAQPLQAIRVTPDSWVDVICQSLDRRRLDHDQWAALTGLPYPVGDICASPVPVQRGEAAPG